jgi:Uma2 family endonuclease
MSTALILPLMTVERFFELPDPDGPFGWELHFGELVKVGSPKKSHYIMQIRIRELLKKKLGLRRWFIDTEVPYGLTPGYDYRAADVACVLRKRWEADPDEDCLIGSPDIVVQVKSRSNRDRKMEEDAVLHITHGASAVWLVKPERQEVVVITASSREVYKPGQTIPLPGSASLNVGDIFSV